MIHDDLLKIWDPRRKPNDQTKLEAILASQGGAYRTSGRDSVFFRMYTNVEFLPTPPEATRRGVTVTLVVDTPPGGAARDKDAKKRFAYWEHSRSLQGSSLVVLMVVSNRTVHTYLGVIASFSKDIAESSKAQKDRIRVRVAFFDTAVELMALRGEKLGKGKGSFAVLVDNSVMFDAVKPFLQKLQTTEPTEIPFSRYIASEASLKDVEVKPPKYATVPGFKYNLQCLAKERCIIADLDVSQPLSIARARHQLKHLSVLDPSQADAVVDTLTREVSLIHGRVGLTVLWL